MGKCPSNHYYFKVSVGRNKDRYIMFTHQEDMIKWQEDNGGLEYTLINNPFGWKMKDLAKEPENAAMVTEG